MINVIGGLIDRQFRTFFCTLCPISSDFSIPWNEGLNNGLVRPTVHNGALLKVLSDIGTS